MRNLAGPSRKDGRTDRRETEIIRTVKHNDAANLSLGRVRRLQGRFLQCCRVSVLRIVSRFEVRELSRDSPQAGGAWDNSQDERAAKDESRRDARTDSWAGRNGREGKRYTAERADGWVD